MSAFRLRPSGREWTFVLTSAQGETLLKGGLHATRAFALLTLQTVRERLVHPTSIVLTQTPAGRHAFTLTASDGRSIGNSCYYSSPERRDEMLRACVEIGRTAVTREESEVIATADQDITPPALSHGQDGSRLQTAAPG